ncbi:DUF1684 domain-containing protein [Brachybacterium sp. NBEC-018]|uniref:DUF1684 domain-containing protein n=1 Tax=Brachybacterium sp. NBEC-018 TaxID=2996004 RepID=UPI002174EEF1|nr:DUF1684 domain-containing protein [Brachybacterium sp. NBEC-018]UVY85042.1 DUF1684 domain-containing protein [Brachybacterium sp. NBEC-018]
MTTSPTTAASVAPVPPEQAGAPAEWLAFRHHREEQLAVSHGVLSQVALHWVDPEAAEQTFAGLPGSWSVEDGLLTVRWRGAELTVLAGSADVTTDEVADVDGTVHRATVTTPGDVRLAAFAEDVQIDVIRRGGRTGLRVLDPQAPRRTAFTHVPTAPYDPSLVLSGTWREQPATVTVGSALPWLEQHLDSPGVATLEIDGRPVELVLTGTANILFTDEASGSSTPDWRVVTAEIDGDRLTVDLNRAVAFPAAFSAWATCPRPPAGNHLPIAALAGELRVERTER